MMKTRLSAFFIPFLVITGSSSQDSTSIWTLKTKWSIEECAALLLSWLLCCQSAWKKHL